MLKRRPSKRFVLAETGEETSWDTTTDNDSTITTQIPQIDIENVASSAIETNESEQDIALQKFQQQQQLQASQRLTVQQPLKSGMK
jgi:hypothetical protein